MVKVKVGKSFLGVWKKGGEGIGTLKRKGVAPLIKLRRGGEKTQYVGRLIS